MRDIIEAALFVVIIMMLIIYINVSKDNKKSFDDMIYNEEVKDKGLIDVESENLENIIDSTIKKLSVGYDNNSLGSLKGLSAFEFLLSLRLIEEPGVTHSIKIRYRDQNPTELILLNYETEYDRKNNIVLLTNYLNGIRGSVSISQLYISDVEFVHEEINDEIVKYFLITFSNKS